MGDILTGFIVAYTTVGKKADARRIAETIIEEGLAACVNIVPGLSSVYRWKGKTVTEKEYLLAIKTRKSLIPLLEKTIQSLHPYELPEFITLDISYGSSDYLQWLSTNTKKTKRRKT
ncbi:MAG: divalent-cation tolerance protein CutA [Deltaproteobacteria bacterium]|nr:divalent-cation tolerance protein CutA [Deltaproteobacteria bacterium]